MIPALAARSGAACCVALGVSLVTGTGAASAETPVLGGGAGIVVDDSRECTLTVIGHDAAGRLIGLTAGHCGETGQPVAAERDPDAGTVGRIEYTDRRLDYAVIEFDPGRVRPSDRIDGLTITAVGAPAQFPASVCKKGRTTGTNCGMVWASPPNGAQTWTQLCVLPGDSGAPVVAGSTVVGMVNANAAVECLGPEVGTTMAAVLGDIDARGGVGSGFRLAG